MGTHHTSYGPTNPRTRGARAFDRTDLVHRDADFDPLIIECHGGTAARSGRVHIEAHPRLQLIREGGGAMIDYAVPVFWQLGCGTLDLLHTLTGGCIV